MVDLEAGKLLDVINSHKQSEIIISLQELLPQALRDGVEEVSIDMWGGFTKIVRTIFPNAAIVYDHFHVIKHVNQELNHLRKRLKVTGKGLRFLCLKNREDLTAEQEERLVANLQNSPCLKIAYEFKEELRQIYRTTRTVSSGKSRLQKWLRFAKLLFQKSAVMIEKHLDGICNYFKNHTTSGITEGINTKIKLIKRQAYGLPEFKHLRLRLLTSFND